MRPLIERLAETTASLVREPTVSGDGPALNACLARLRDDLRARRPALRVREFPAADTPALLCWTGDAAPRLLLVGHLDVVPISVADQWQPRLEPDDRLWGRGAADMKGPIAALLDVFIYEPLDGVGLLLTTDEEVGGLQGTEHVLAALDWRPEVAVLPDGGANMRLVAEQKGVLRLLVVAQGLAAHSARPWLGENAVTRLMAGYRALLRAYPLPTAEDDWRPSIALTQATTGDNAPNSIPGRACATLDIRFPAQGRSAAELLADISARLERHHVTVESATTSSAFHLDGASPWVARLQGVARRMRGADLPLVRESGASDGRFFSQRGVPALIFQPECAGWHGPAEWVDLHSLADFREIVARLVRQTLQ